MQQQSNLDKIFFWALCALLFCIPGSQWLSTRLLVVVLVLSFFAGKFDFKLWFYRAWDIGLYLAVLLLGLTYTTNIDLGLRVLETSFSLLAVPFIFSKIPSLDDKLFNKLYISFALGVVVAGIVSVSYAFYRYTNTHEVGVFFFYDLTAIINSHPTYFAYYLIFALTVVLYKLYYETPLVSVSISIILTIFFFIVLILTGGSTAFISLLLILSFFILKYTLEASTKNKTIVLVMVCFMLAILFVMNSADYWYDQLALGSDYWERSDLWRSAILANDNPFFGVGTGDYTIVLNDYYRTHGLSEFAESSYNSHNQFIQVYLSNGLVGLFAVLLMSVRPLYLALRERFPFGILIFFPIIIYGMNEVLLGRFQGVIFFVIMHQLLIAYYGSHGRAAALNAGKID